jgi:hypothetical protein
MTTLRAILPLLRPFPLVVVGVLAALPGRAPSEVVEAAPNDDLGPALAAEGLRVEAVTWVDSAWGLGRLWRKPRALVQARAGDAPADIYLVVTHQSPEGRVIGIDEVSNLTNTSIASECGLAVRGVHAAWLIGSDSAVYRVELADLGGLPPPPGEQWPRLAQYQHAITNWQRTGSVRGVGRRSFKLEPAMKSVKLEPRDDAFVVLADGHRIVIPFDRRTPIEGQRYVVEEDRELARPGNFVTWAVDRARESSWLGNDRMQWIKAVAFAGLDTVERSLGRVRADDSAERIAEELGGPASPPLEFRAVQTGWPPPPVRPVLRAPLDGEGHWRLSSDEPFHKTNPGAPPAMATAFIRTDEERDYSRIFVALWDPRQVDLHMMPGTEEPQTATGETGSGRIPREPLLTRLVAAFNGAFQSTHGDYGMMVDRHVLVPPRPYAATIAKLDDGTTGLGTWPHDLTIDDRLVSFRQNLTPLVAGGELNPYDRQWWGGVPEGWEDETRTVRSGLCLTKEGFLAYFYGSKVDHEHLGTAMQSARCEYGLHLDMNQGHTGLEFYRVDRASELPTAGPLDGQWQAEGDVAGLDGYRFRGRRLIRNMQLMHFPRYIRRSQRDFFYLTLRHLLPPEAIALPGAEAGEGVWQTDGLPQHGWPHVIASTEIRPDPLRTETKLRLLAIDPKFLESARPSDAEAVVLAVDPVATDAPSSALWHERRGFSLGPAPPSTEAARVFSGSPMPGAATRAAVGLDARGMAIYAEVATGADPAKDGALLEGVLKRLGCLERLFFTTPPIVALAGARDLGGHPVALGGGAIRLKRFALREARRIFEETPILPRSDWLDLQQQRRFFAREAPSASPPSRLGP